MKEIFWPNKSIVMTTEQLRKEITVSHWNINIEGISIRYYKNSESDPIWLKLTPEESARELCAIGSIDEVSEGGIFNNLMLREGTVSRNWNGFIKEFKLCQWEALTLAIRHEMNLETEKDVNLLEMDKAIEALKNI
jgi:hypothetical protein